MVLNNQVEIESIKMTMLSLENQCIRNEYQNLEVGWTYAHVMFDNIYC